MRIALGLLTVACSVVVLHCSAGLPCHGAIECGLEPDGGPDGGADVVVPPGCDPTKSPKESPACVTDDFGVFVSPLGKDGATGKKTDPLRSIAEAVGKGKPRVYVCEGTYDANVAITTSVAIYGGLTCLWQPSEAVRPKLAPPKGIALRVTKVAGAVEIADLDVVGSADANTPGDSAIASFVAESANVTFRRTTLTGGTSTGGAKGAARSNYSGVMATKGGDAMVATGGVGPMCACTDLTSSTGGNGASGAGIGLSDGAANPAVGFTNSGATKVASCDPGLAGANGSAGATAPTVTSAGSLDANGWQPPGQVTTAPNGKPAQGGGGAGAKTNTMSAGGAGGCGGCGGAGAEAGRAGGSSFALLSFNSSVTFEGGNLGAGTGGTGGTGGRGQDGQAGGAPGTGIACDGGSGGNGTGGSGGGGAAGGHSVPVAFVGTEPKVTGATVTPGTKGAAGPGGAGGAGPGIAGAPGTPGPEGKAQTTLAL